VGRTKRSFEELLALVVAKSGRTRDEIMEMVSKYVEEYDGILNEEGALYLVAHDLGISFLEDRPKEEPSGPVPVDKLTPGMKKAVLEGRITKMYGVLRFRGRDGSEGERGEFLLADKSGTVRVVVWSKSLIEKIRAGEVKEGDVVRIKGVRIGKRGSEVVANLDSSAQLEVLEGEFPDYPSPIHRPLKVSEIFETEAPEIDVLGVVSAIFDIREFERKDGSTGRLLSFIIRDEENDDGVRVVLWDEKTELIRSISVGDRVVLENFRLRFRDDVPELHSTVRSSIKPLPKSKEDIEGELVFITGIKTTRTRRGSLLRLLRFVLRRGNVLFVGKAWEDAADTLSRACPAVIRIKGAIVYGEGSVRKIVLRKDSEIEIIRRLENQLDDREREKCLSALYPRSWIEDLSRGSAEVRGTITQMSDVFIRWYCSSCGREVIKEYGRFTCEECGEGVEAFPRASMFMTVEDGTGVLRVILLDSALEKFLGKTLDEMLKEIEMNALEEDRFPTDELRDRILGRDFIFRGTVRVDGGSVGMIADEIASMNVMEEIVLLKKKLLEEMKRFTLKEGVDEKNNR